MTEQYLNEEKEMELINAIESLQEIKERAIRLLEETTEILGSPALNGKLRHFEAYGSYGLDQFIGGSTSNPYDSSITTIIEELIEEKENI